MKPDAKIVGEMNYRIVKAAVLSRDLQLRIDAVRERAASLKPRPRVYFEEWDEPMISAIGWVSDLIEIAGGENVFADRAYGKAARDRFVTSEK